MKSKYVLCWVVFLAFICACQFGAVSTQPPISTLPALDNPAGGTDQEPPLSLPAQNNQSLPPQVDFFMDDANELIVPDGILEQIVFSAVGGPDGEEVCRYPSDQPYIDPTGYPQDTEVGFFASFYTCGWADPTALVTTVTYPDGTLVTLPPDEYGRSDYIFFETEINAPVGLYTFRISDGITTLEANTFFRERTLAGVEYTSSNQAYLHHFEPYESVRFLAYRETSSDLITLVGEEVFTVNENGELLINLPDGFYTYVLINSEGAEVVSAGLFSYAQSDQDVAKQNTREFYDQIHHYPPCSPAENIQALSLNTMIVLSNPAGGLLYANPRTNANNIVVFPPETTLTIAHETPLCAEGLVWRAVRMQDEKGGTLYAGFMIEVDANGQTYMGVQEQVQPTCGTLASRLSVGTPARVAFSDGSNMRIRSGPGFSQEILNKVPEGTLLNILEGPRCVDGSNWWRIRTENGLEGWMTETQDGVYLLEPYES